MNLFTINERRDVVLSVDLLRQLGVRPGMPIVARELPDGRVRIEFDRSEEHAPSPLPE